MTAVTGWASTGPVSAGTRAIAASIGTTGNNFIGIPLIDARPGLAAAAGAFPTVLK